LSPSRRRTCIDHVRQTLDGSERRVCRVLGQRRSTQRKAPRGRDDEERLTADIIELARERGRACISTRTARVIFTRQINLTSFIERGLIWYGRYGYRRIAELLRRARSTLIQWCSIE
jgi:hypothetical protein